MALTPVQPPSTDTTSTPDFPAAFSAVFAPSAAGSLIVYTRLMSGLFCRQFSIAVCPLAWSPAVSRLHTTCGSVACCLASGVIPETPKPDRKPLWRSTPTVMPGARSSVAIFAVLPAIVAFAYWPMSWPAV